MADPESKPNADPRAMTIETAQVGTRSGTVNTTQKGEQKVASTLSGGSVTVGKDTRDALGSPGGTPGESTEAPLEAGTPEGTSESDTGGADAGGEREVPDLGEYEPSDPEVAAKFDEHYFTEDSKLNVSALEKEWFANGKDGQPGTLNEATYKYLEHRLGLPKDVVDGYAEGLVLKAEKSNAEFFAGAGGKERFEQALSWAKEGGYTEAQRSRFNDALNKGGADAEDARDALMGRFSKSRNKAEREQRRGPGGVPEVPRNPANAKRDAARGGSGAGPAAKPFETREEYTKAWRSADKNDSKTMATLRQRLAASPDHVKN
jgi:hypothetical protein